MLSFYSLLISRICMNLVINMLWEEQGDLEAVFSIQRSLKVMALILHHRNRLLAQHSLATHQVLSIKLWTLTETLITGVEKDLSFRTHMKNTLPRRATSIPTGIHHHIIQYQLRVSRLGIISIRRVGTCWWWTMSHAGQLPAIKNFTSLSNGEVAPAFYSGWGNAGFQWPIPFTTGTSLWHITMLRQFILGLVTCIYLGDAKGERRG